MKKLWKYGNEMRAILVLLIMLIATTTIGYGSQGEFEITYISNGSEESERYDLSVKVIGNGALYDGDAAIKHEVSVYQLPINQSKSFRVQREEGNTLQSITLNGKDITTTIKGDVIKVDGQTYAQELIVTFQSEQIGSGNIDTADKTQKGILLLGILGAGFMILFLMNKNNLQRKR